MNNQFSHMQKLAFGKPLTTKESIHESTLKEKIKELVHASLDEAKKKKKEPEDVAPQEDVDIDLNMEEPPTEPTAEPTDTMTPTDGGMDIDPTVKSIQDSLQKAYASAKQLGDEKLMNQIGNTITMLVRTQVLGGQASE
jgi:hypothetical protein